MAIPDHYPSGGVSCNVDMERGGRRCFRLNSFHVLDRDADIDIQKAIQFYDQNCLCCIVKLLC
ncbi:hypothetical protein CDL12_24952 [Handroanthus impetiginosus]|uniref:Uncharacterized protein n=1 Tax=Handroanthus impetiginosus TaxID=429701 RepID=A0A2G9GB76_9LAMI|nr:hypothetical protein CDL12_24952 [Handroanthus impetiginosus]